VAGAEGWKNGSVGGGKPPAPASPPGTCVPVATCVPMATCAPPGGGSSWLSIGDVAMGGADGSWGADGAAPPRVAKGAPLPKRSAPAQAPSSKPSDTTRMPALPDALPKPASARNPCPGPAPIWIIIMASAPFRVLPQRPCSAAWLRVGVSMAHDGGTDAATQATSSCHCQT
jgi:hypothetical protein